MNSRIWFVLFGRINIYLLQFYGMKLYIHFNITLLTTLENYPNGKKALIFGSFQNDQNNKDCNFTVT